MSPAKKSPAEIRREKQAEEALHPAGALPPGVEPGESLDPKENPRVGEQDLPVEERTDGRTEDGTRYDQMDGVQAAHWDNDLSVEEEIKRNKEHNPQVADRRHLSKRTQDEISRGKDALGGRKAPKKG